GEPDSRVEQAAPRRPRRVRRGVVPALEPKHDAERLHRGGLRSGDRIHVVETPAQLVDGAGLRRDYGLVRGDVEIDLARGERMLRDGPAVLRGELEEVWELHVGGAGIGALAHAERPEHVVADLVQRMDDLALRL